MVGRRGGCGGGAGSVPLRELLREPYCYIDGRADYDRETAMRTTAYLGSFAVLESPGRIVDALLENR